MPPRRSRPTWRTPPGGRSTGAARPAFLSDEDREIGVLDDVALDDDGALTALIVGPARIDADDLLGVGTYATVVRDPGGP